MKPTYILILLSLVIGTLFSFDLPKGWYAAGSKPGGYEMGLEMGKGRDEKTCATIQSKEKKITGLGTLMQACAPAKYLGKRIRMTGYIKTQDAIEQAGMWLRVDNNGKSIAFDNMGSRAIKVTHEWKQYEIVLDVA
jgi:hypothetical protein